MRSRKRKWWKKCKELIISLSMMRMKKDEKEKKSKKKRKTPQSEGNLGEILEVALSLFDSGAELAERQCCSRRPQRRTEEPDEDAAGSADQRRQMGGENPVKVEAAKR